MLKKQETERQTSEEKMPEKKLGEEVVSEGTALLNEPIEKPVGSALQEADLSALPTSKLALLDHGSYSPTRIAVSQFAIWLQESVAVE
jgi:hypothetical protein